MTYRTIELYKMHRGCLHMMDIIKDMRAAQGFSANGRFGIAVDRDHQARRWQKYRELSYRLDSCVRARIRYIP